MQVHVSVLLVEKNGDDARRLTELLGGRGLVVIESANDLAEASRTLERTVEGYPVIILDLDSADGDGQEVIRQLRESAGSIPVICLASEDADEAIQVQSIANGAQDLLIKWHFSGPQLERAVRGAIWRHQREAKLRSRLAELEQRLNSQQAMAAIGERTAKLAHDFGNAMALVVGWCSRARRKLDNLAEVSTSLAAAERAAEQATRLVKSLWECAQAAERNTGVADGSPVPEEEVELPDKPILLACGSSHMQGIVGGMLRSIGCEVTLIPHEERLMSCIDEYERACLVLMHQDAFDGRALDCLSMMRRSGSTVPVVLIAGKHDESINERLYTAVLREPLSTPKLREALREGWHIR